MTPFRVDFDALNWQSSLPGARAKVYSTLAFRMRNHEQLVEARHSIRQKTILAFGMIGIGESNCQRITEHG